MSDQTLETALIALAPLAILLALAFMFRPKSYTVLWRDLSATFGTDERPAKYSFREIPFYRPTTVTRWFFDNRHIGEYALFDVEIDDEGFWLKNDTPGDAKCAERMFIPWSRISFSKRKGNYCRYSIFASKPVDIVVPIEFAANLEKPTGNDV